MTMLKAFARLRRGTSPDTARPPAFSPGDAATAAICCRHCGSPRLKLSYRRYETSADADAPKTTFILRCGDCEGFTTVVA